LDGGWAGVDGVDRPAALEEVEGFVAWAAAEVGCCAGGGEEGYCALVERLRWGAGGLGDVAGPVGEAGHLRRLIRAKVRDAH
jgi:hypothetical protein